MTTWLHEQRLEAARKVVRDSGAGTVLDLDCGHGDLMVRLAMRSALRDMRPRQARSWGGSS